MNTEYNPIIASAVAASWTVPSIAAARSKRYAAAVQKNGVTVEMFKSVPAALRSLGVMVGQRSIRAAARDCERVELEVNGEMVAIVALEVSI